VKDDFRRAFLESIQYGKFLADVASNIADIGKAQQVPMSGRRGRW
jgi:hypothetical protein